MLSEEPERIEQTPNEEPKRKTRKNHPKLVTDFLKEWMVEHKHHPYPEDSCKLEMSRKFNLTATQINNWFINNRRRFLKKMFPENEKAKESKRKRPINGSIQNKKHKHDSENEACSSNSSGTSLSYEDYMSDTFESSLQDSAISNSSSSSSPCVDRKSLNAQIIRNILQNRAKSFPDDLAFLAEVTIINDNIERLSFMEISEMNSI